MALKATDGIISAEFVERTHNGRGRGWGGGGHRGGGGGGVRADGVAQIREVE